jgi:peptidoglycan/LPS O-acetylase OafA/YrhL
MAALSVVSFHLAYYSWASDFSTTSNAFGHAATFESLAPYTWFGWIGVEIFFVISGFVIAYSAEGSTPYRFVVSRATRLLPAAWICSAITLLVVLAGHLLAPREAIIETLRTAVMFPFGPWIDGAYWTLGIEISFYTLIFVLLLLDRFRLVERVVGAVGVASVIYWVLASLPVPDWIVTLADHRSGELSLLPHGCFFALGVLLWAMTKQGVTRSRVLLAAVLAIGAILEILHASRGFASDRPSIVPVLVFVAAFAGIAGSIAFNGRILALVGGLAPTIRVVGLATYPLYLIHNVVGSFTERELIALGVNKFAGLAGAFCLMIASAIVIVLVVEPPVKQALRTFMLDVGRRLHFGRSPHPSH